MCLLVIPVCNDPADVAFAVDMSGSIGLANFRTQIDFTREVVFGLNMPQHQISLTTFGNDAQVRYTSNTSDVHVGLILNL